MSLGVVVTPGCHDAVVGIAVEDGSPASLPVSLAAVRIARRAFGLMVGGLDPDVVPFGDVTELWSEFDRIERFSASAKTLLAARVDEAGDWQRAGARSAAGHLAKLGGTTAGAARRSLETSKQVAELPVLAEAMRGGVLSGVQADAIAGVATADEVSRIEKALEPFIDDIFKAAWAEGRREPRAAYAFDALVMLAERDDAAVENKRAPKPGVLTLLHADVEALRRGWIEGEETCEIVGVGPVPVRVARDLLGESILKLVISRGVDVANVVHLGRGPTAAQRIALLWSSPKCSNIECSRMRVEIDHSEPWAETKHMVLDNLDPLCGHDHDLKTNHGWSLVEGTGRRAFVPPDDPRHPRNKPPP